MTHCYKSFYVYHEFGYDFVFGNVVYINREFSYWCSIKVLNVPIYTC